MSKTEKWIIDFDIGDDIDDLFALEYAISAGLDIVGITTVFRSTLLRAKLARLVVEKMGKDIPVFAGEDLPLIEPLDSRQKIDRWLPKERREHHISTGEKWLPQYLPEADNMKVEEQSAVDFIVESAKNEKGKLGIIAIGPLTNIAKCILKDSDAMKNISEILIMGANLEPKPEWNIGLDPEAGKIVFEFGVPIWQVGSKLTWEYATLTSHETEETLKGVSPLARLNKECVALWKELPVYHNRDLCLHDCFPIFHILDNNGLQYIQGKMKVGIDGEERGKTYFIEDKSGTVFCAVGIDKKKYDKSFFDHIRKATS